MREPKYILKFEIEVLPKTPNALLGSHWTVRSKHAKKWDRLVWAKCWHVKPAKPLSRAKITLIRFSSVAPDYDGLVGSFKPVIDALVKNGVLIDDNQAVIGVPLYKFHSIGPKKGKIQIEVEEV